MISQDLLNITNTPWTYFLRFLLIPKYPFVNTKSRLKHYAVPIVSQGLKYIYQMDNRADMFIKFCPT